MVFQKLFGGERKPFLELSEGGGDQPAATVAPVASASKSVTAAPVTAASSGPKAVTLKVPVAVAVAVAEGAAAANANTTDSAAPSAGPSLTTAEALAAERAAAQKAEVPRELTTFAAELLNPGQALPRGRRRPGANLAPFRDLAASMRGGR